MVIGLCGACLNVFGKGNTPYMTSKATHRMIPDTWPHPDTDVGQKLLGGPFMPNIECPICKKGDILLHSATSLELILLSKIKELKSK